MACSKSGPVFFQNCLLLLIFNSHLNPLLFKLSFTFLSFVFIRLSPAHYYLRGVTNRGWDKSILTKVNCEQYRYGNILRFPRAAGELPRALALRDLTDASPPAGVYVDFLRWYSLSFAFTIIFLFCPGLISAAKLRNKCG